MDRTRWLASSVVIRCHCLAHGRRQFSDLEAVFPSECRVVIDALKQVFDHDEEARDQRMSAEARLAYHQAYSQPLMDDLKAWLAGGTQECVGPAYMMENSDAILIGDWTLI